MSKQPTRSDICFIIRVRNFILRFIGSSVSRASGQCLRKCSMSGARAIHEFRHRACSAQVADLHLPLVVHVAVLVSLSWSTRPAIFRATPQRRAFLRLPSSSSLAYCRRHGRASGGPLAVFPKIASTGAEPAPLARALLLIGSRARLSRRLRHGSGIGTRSGHTVWASEFWPCCGFSAVSKRTAPCAAETSKLTVGG